MQKQVRGTSVQEWADYTLEEFAEHQKILSEQEKKTLVKYLNQCEKKLRLPKLAGGLHWKGRVWMRKSIKQYHYHATKDDFVSLCGVSSYFRAKSEFKEIEFLADIEMTPDMRVCHNCYSARQTQIKEKIITHHKATAGFWDDSCACPKCKSKVMFWNHSKSKEHLCTVCNKMVVLA